MPPQILNLVTAIIHIPNQLFSYNLKEKKIPILAKGLFLNTF